MSSRCSPMPGDSLCGSVCHRLAAIVACGLLVCAGCGQSGSQFHDVSGQLTYQGKPIPAGAIYFDPDTSRGNRGRQGYGLIHDGRFDTAAGGKGTVAGPHLVRVLGYDGLPAGEGAEFGRPLFPEYTLKRDISPGKTTLDIDVPLAPIRPSSR